MPWWSWFVIWGALVAALLALLAWQGIRLFRKLMATLGELGDLAEKASILDERAESLNAENPNEQRGGYAVFANAGRLASARREEARRRAEIRQARRDARVRQGKLLVHEDPLQFSHLTKRT